VTELEIFDEDSVVELVGRVMKTVDAYSLEEPVSYGEVISALFTAMMYAARHSPDYDPEKFEQDLIANLMTFEVSGHG
jgi:hypothetical protein